MKAACMIALLACAHGGTLKLKDDDGSFCAITTEKNSLAVSCGTKSVDVLEEFDAIKNKLNDIETEQDYLSNAIRSYMPCEPGMHKNFNDDAHTEACIRCSGNSFTAEFNVHIACNVCPTGYAHDEANPDHTFCDVCAPGYGANSLPFDKNHQSCDVCNKDEFSKKNSACAPCPNNTHTDGLNASSACPMCAAGFGYSTLDDDGHAICHECVQGTNYSTGGTMSCLDLPTCPAGKGTISGFSFSTIKNYSNNSIVDYCEDCSEITKYSDVDSLSSCETHKNCPAGQGVVRSTNSSSSISIRVSDNSSRVCEDCPDDKYSATDAFAQCYLYNSVKYVKTDNKTAPLKCAAGHYLDGGEIAYTPSTGSLKKDVCTSCGYCSTPIKTACERGQPAVCCHPSDKPALSTFIAKSAALDITCSFTCNDPNAIQIGTGISGICVCINGWKRDNSSSMCSKVEDPVYAIYTAKMECSGYYYYSGCYGYEAFWEIHGSKTEIHGNSTGEEIQLQVGATYNLTMKDTYGDGWNGNKLSLYNSYGKLVNGPFELLSGDESEEEFTVSPTLTCESLDPNSHESIVAHAVMAKDPNSHLHLRCECNENWHRVSDDYESLECQPRSKPTTKNFFVKMVEGRYPKEVKWVIGGKCKKGSVHCSTPKEAESSGDAWSDHMISLDTNTQYTLYMTDTYGDGWNGADWSLFDSTAYGGYGNPVILASNPVITSEQQTTHPVLALLYGYSGKATFVIPS